MREHVDALEEHALDGLTAVLAALGEDRHGSQRDERDVATRRATTSAIVVRRMRGGGGERRLADAVAQRRVIVRAERGDGRLGGLDPGVDVQAAEARHPVAPGALAVVATGSSSGSRPAAPAYCTLTASPQTTSPLLSMRPMPSPRLATRVFGAPTRSAAWSSWKNPPSTGTSSTSSITARA